MSVFKLGTTARTRCTLGLSNCRQILLSDVYILEFIVIMRFMLEWELG